MSKHVSSIETLMISLLFAVQFVGIMPLCSDAESADADPGKEGTVFEMSLDELLKMEITTASKIPEPWSKTTSSVSVITAEDLRRMGARTIYDALRIVPGINTGVGNFGENFISIRGIHTTKSEKILVLLNGHMLNDVRNGSATYQFRFLTQMYARSLA